MSSVRSAVILCAAVSAGLVLCAGARAQCRQGGGSGGGGGGRGGPGGPGVNGGLALFQQQQLQQLVARQQALQIQELNLQVRKLAKDDPSAVEEALQSPSAATRWAAARVVALKSLPLQDRLIELLTDPDYLVRQAARQGLVRLSARAQDSKKKRPTGRGVDFGPVPNASSAARTAAARKWRAWWKRQDVGPTFLTARSPTTVPTDGAKRSDSAAKLSQPRGGSPAFLTTDKGGGGQGRGNDDKP